MSADLLRQIIQQGENLDIEFKGESQRQLSDDEIVRAVVCMANRVSALCVLGVLVVHFQEKTTTNTKNTRKHEEETDEAQTRCNTDFS